MKRCLLLLALLSVPLHGAPISKRIDASSTNIPTSFAGTNGAVGLPSNLVQIDSLVVDNRSTGEVAVNCQNGPLSGTPSDSSTYNVYVNAGSAWSMDNYGFGTVCYIRSMTGSAITSGIVVVSGKGITK